MKNLLVIILFLSSLVSSQAQVLSPNPKYQVNNNGNSPKSRAYKKRNKIKQHAFKKHQKSLEKMAMADGKMTRNERKMLKRSYKKNQKMNKRHHRARANRGFNRK